MEKKRSFEGALKGFVCGSVLGFAKNENPKSVRELYLPWDEKLDFKKFIIKINHKTNDTPTISYFIYILKMSELTDSPEDWFQNTGADYYLNYLDYKTYLKFELENNKTDNLDYSTIIRLLPLRALLLLDTNHEPRALLSHLLCSFDSFCTLKRLNGTKKSKKNIKTDNRLTFLYNSALLVSVCDYLLNLKDRLEYGDLIFYLSGEFAKTFYSHPAYVIVSNDGDTIRTIFEESLTSLKISMNSQGTDDSFEVMKSLVEKTSRLGFGLVELLLAIYIFSLEAAYPTDAVKAAANINRLLKIHGIKIGVDSELLAAYVGYFSGLLYGDEWIPFDWNLEGNHDRIYQLLISSSMDSLNDMGNLITGLDAKGNDTCKVGMVNLKKPKKEALSRVFKEVISHSIVDRFHVEHSHLTFEDPIQQSLF